MHAIELLVEVVMEVVRKKKNPCPPTTQVVNNMDVEEKSYCYFLYVPDVIQCGRLHTRQIYSNITHETLIPL